MASRTIISAGLGSRGEAPSAPWQKDELVFLLEGIGGKAIVVLLSRLQGLYYRLIRIGEIVRRENCRVSTGGL